MSRCSLRLPDSLLEKVRELAEEEHISINQFITTELAEKISALTVEEYLTERAQRGSREKFEHALLQVLGVEPEERDRLDR